MNQNNQHILKTTKFIFTRTISQQNHMTTIKSVSCLIVWSRDMYSIQWLTSVSMKQWPRSAQLNLYHIKTMYKKYIFFTKHLADLYTKLIICLHRKISFYFDTNNSSILFIMKMNKFVQTNRNEWHFLNERAS